MARACPRRGGARRGRRRAPCRQAPRGARARLKRRQRRPDPRVLDQRELRDVRHRRGAEALEVAPHQGRQRRVGRLPPRVAGGVPAATYDGRGPNDHGPPVGACSSGEDGPQRPPHALGGDHRARLEPRLDLRDRPRLREELQQLRHQRVGVRDRQAALDEAAIAQPAAAQRRLQRRMHGGAVLGRHHVQRDPHEGRLDEGPSVKARSRSAGSKPAMRFHSARYGDAASWACTATTRRTASTTSSGSRRSSSCRASVARLSPRP